MKALDEHRLADGRRLLVTHGDQFDIVVRGGRLLPMLGAKGYNLLLAANKPFNAVRRKMGLPYASLSKRVKHSVKAACKHISNFEELLMLEAEDRGLDGVVCGHIHHPAFRPRAEYPEQPADYYNCGDWVEGATALVEHADGRLELIDAESVLAADEAAGATERPMTEPAEEPLPSLDELIAYGRVFPTRPPGAASPAPASGVEVVVSPKLRVPGRR